MKNKLSKDMKNINWRRKKMLFNYCKNFESCLIQKKDDSKNILKNDTIEIISELQKKLIKLLEENIQLNKLIVELTHKNQDLDIRVKILESSKKKPQKDSDLEEINNKMKNFNVSDWEFITEGKN